MAIKARGPYPVAPFAGAFVVPGLQTALVLVWGACANCGAGRGTSRLMGAAENRQGKDRAPIEVCQLEMETKLDLAGGGNKNSYVASVLAL